MLNENSWEGRLKIQTKTNSVIKSLWSFPQNDIDLFIHGILVGFLVKSTRQFHIVVATEISTPVRRTVDGVV